MATQSFTVSGMSCSHGVNAVTEELSAVPGVTDVQVSLDSGAVTVTSERELPQSALAEAVEEAGYSITRWAEAS